jgi:hypothetical protein
MDNLSQEKQRAKQEYLNRQRADMISRYKQADQTERTAIIRHVDSFLPVLSGDEKTFWLKFRRELEKLGERSTGVRAQKCSMDCGARADYDGKYCWTCVERAIREIHLEDGMDDGDGETGDEQPRDDVPF